jgi:hypothetical protein
MPNVFDLLKNVALKNVATTAVRHGLNSLGTVLVAHGYATQADWTTLALDVSPIIVSALLSLLASANAAKREDVALDMSPGQTKQDVTAAIKAGA